MDNRKAAPRSTELVRQARSMMALPPMLAPRMEQFWKAQDGLLDEAEAFTRDWYRRRHEATQSALAALRGVNGKGAEPAATMQATVQATIQAMTEWQRHSFERLTEDMQQWMGFCSRCAGRLASAETEPAGEAADAAARPGQGAAGTKHATPV